MNHETDTPRTDACPHCGAELDRRSTINAGYWCYECGSTYRGGDLCQSPLCRERKARQKAEAENVCLQELIQEFYEWSRRDFPTEQEVREIMSRYHDLLNK